MIPIGIIPLRERLEDIPLLTSHFIEKYNEENNKEVKSVDDAVFRLFMKYHWPGNVRELENYIERAVVTSPNNHLVRGDFPPELALGKLGDQINSVDSGITLAEGEKYLILKTLEKCNGNKTRAAELLDITPRTIRNKLSEYEITNSD